MKRIFNWTFGSIFRTFGRIIAYLSVGLLLGFILSKTGLKLPDLLPIMKVSAATVTIDNYETIPNGTYYDCTSSGCSSLSTTTDVYQTLNNEYNMQVNSSTMTIASNGVAFTYQPYETFKSGYLYNVTTYFCSNKNLSSTSKSQFLGSATSSVSTNYSTTSSNSMHSVGTFNYCYEIQSLISPKSNATQVTYKLTSSSSISGVYLYSLGFKIKDLGLYTSEVQSIVQSVIQSNTSGLATTNQLNEVSEEIQQKSEETTDAVNEQLGNKCSNIFNPTLKTATTHRGITFTPVLNSKTNNVTKYWVKGTRTSGSNAYVNVMSNLNLKKGTKIKVWGDNKVALQIYYASNSQVISNIYDEFTLTQDLNGVNFDVYTTEDEIQNTIEFKAMVSESTTIWCEYGSYTSKIDDTNNSINDLKDSINDDDSSGAQSEASDFFSNFTTNTHGLTGIITAPLNAIQSLTSKSCSPLVLPLPFVNQNLTLPCMRDIYVQNFGAFMNIYDVITLGIISYWIMVRIFALVKDFKNPDHDEIEVMDL